MDTPGQPCLLHHRGQSHPFHPHQTHLRTDSKNPDKALATVFSLKLASAMYDPRTEGTQPPDLIVTATEPHVGDSSTAVPAAPRQLPPLLSKAEGNKWMRLNHSTNLRFCQRRVADSYFWKRISVILIQRLLEVVSFATKLAGKY